MVQEFSATDRIIFMASNKPTQPPVPPTRPPERDDSNSVVLERRTQRVGPPQMYQVVMLNDDYTPMEFVVVVIQEFFSKDLEAATAIMLKIHLDGKGVCGVYSKDVAATKVDQVLEAAHKAGHPLKCVAEPVDF
jgi:ATP-dependent Clp protease adaptor protein ClpS